MDDLYYIEHSDKISINEFLEDPLEVNRFTSSDTFYRTNYFGFKQCNGHIGLLSEENRAILLLKGLTVIKVCKLSSGRYLESESYNALLAIRGL